MIPLCSVDQICSRPRTPLVGLPRFPANAAHAGGSFKCAAMKIIELTQGRQAIVDDADFLEFSKYIGITR